MFGLLLQAEKRPEPRQRQRRREVEYHEVG
ncbi:MAG: hypothetical protein ACD_43C00094G0004, partial [uncultured bacterium]